MPDANRLKRSLEEGVPVIVVVWTLALPYWTENRPHAVVVVGYDSPHKSFFIDK